MLSVCPSPESLETTPTRCRNRRDPDRHTLGTVLRVAIRDRLKRVPRVYWVLRRARSRAGDLLPPVQLPGVPGRVHRNDTMIPKLTAEHASGYNRRGQQASEFVAGAVARAELPAPPREALDLWSGYGGVLRHLVRQFPDTRWTACDLEAPAVRFCEQEFGAVPVVSSVDLATVAFPTAAYDLVWMGSLLTHLDAAANATVLATLARHANDPCVVTFSTHGPDLARDLARYGPGLAAQETVVQAAIAQTGFAYGAYPHYGDGSYGIAFHDPERVDRMMTDAFGAGAVRLELGRRAWMDHHDLHAFVVRTPT